MVPSAERDSELVTYLAAQRAGLGEPEVVGVRGLAPAHETRLLHDIAKVLAAAIAPRSRDREDAFVNTLRLSGVGAFSGGKNLRPVNLMRRRIIVRGSSRDG